MRRYLPSHGGVSVHELGYFDGIGIALENIDYAWGGQESLIALAVGSVEIGSAATAAVLNSINGGNDFVAADPNDRGHSGQDYRCKHLGRASG